MRIRFFRACEIKGSSYVKITLRSNVISNIRKIDKYCFLRSILVYSHPCEYNHLNRVSIYRQHFDELNNESFDFSNGFRFSDVHNFEKL